MSHQTILKLTVRIYLADGRPYQQFTLHAPRFGIGRTGCALEVNDPFCSGKHAEIYIDERGALSIRDLGSRNGTFLNGRRVDVSEITTDDVIGVGDAQIRVVGWEGMQAMQMVLVDANDNVIQERTAGRGR